MSIGRIEQDIQRIKKEFSEISPGRATRAEPVQKKKGSHSIIIWASFVVIIIAVVVLVIFLLKP
jgi:hypothetical protein